MCCCHFLDRVSGYENMLLGYKPRIHNLIKREKNIDTAMFGKTTPTKHVTMWASLVAQVTCCTRWPVGVSLLCHTHRILTCSL